MSDKVTLKRNKDGVFTVGGKDFPVTWDYLMLYGVQIMNRTTVGNIDLVTCTTPALAAKLTFRKSNRQLIVIDADGLGQLEEITISASNPLLRIYSEGHNTKKPFTFTRGNDGWTCKGKNIRWVFPKDTYGFVVTTDVFDIQLNDSIPPLRMSIDDGRIYNVTHWEDGTHLDTFDIPTDSDFLKGIELHSIEKLV